MSDDERSYEQTAARVRASLKPIFHARKWIVIGGPVVGLRGIALELGKLSGERPFVLGSAIGTGSVPEPAEAEWFSLDIRAENVMDEFRAYEDALRDLPAEARAALDRWDPDGVARAAGLILLSSVPDVAGRPTYAARRPEWVALEDKLEAEVLWSELDLPRSPSETVPLREAALAEATARHDRGDGVVWAGDASEGVHGGGEGTRRVQGPPDAKAALAAFRGRFERVRVMPFLEGVPCSIHGIVFPSDVVALRPVELVTLRSESGSGLVYAGLGTFWDPPPADRDAMRALARRVGAALRERVDYRGPFTVDGVLTRDGFRPTELNPRFGAGLGPIVTSVPKLPFGPLAMAVTAGERLDVAPDALEAVLLARADALRGGRGSLRVTKRVEETRSWQLVADGEDGFRFAREGEESCAALTLGPGPKGGFLNFVPHADGIERGTLLAPFVTRAFAFADRELGTGIGPTQPAKEVRY